MYEEILKDLKTEFGKQRILSTSDIAPYIRKSPAAQYQLRKRKGFPFPIKKVGGLYQISIYDFARWLADETVEPQKAAPVPEISTKKKAVQHRGVSLGKSLFASFAANIEGLQLQVDFLNNLYRELETIELDKLTPKNLGGKTHPPI